jgi:hypothetical protein
MAEITFYDEAFGAGEAGRRSIRSLELEVDTISVADLIRLRVEAAYEHPADVPRGSAEWLRRRHAEREPVPTLEAAIDEARRGLLNNAYFLVVNGRQRRDLEEKVALDDVNQAIFLQLVPLKGG